MAIQEFRFDCKIRKLSPKTIDNYRKQLEYLHRYRISMRLPLAESFMNAVIMEKHMAAFCGLLLVPSKS